MDRNHVQAVKKVLAEFVFGDRPLQVFIRCGKNADVDFNCPGTLRSFETWSPEGIEEV